ncbi:C-type lectin domain family 2 member L-like isoform X3 [Dendrobates tinctorius]|uniref:C-type lectin domain family 2 member L-like isoform X3 n=1 Tax=Dendrobates tinctorius TaxID=92724 RepID=UPI003CC9A110
MWKTFLSTPQHLALPSDTVHISRRQNFNSMVEEYVSTLHHIPSDGSAPFNFLVFKLDTWLELVLYALEVLTCPAANVLLECVFSTAGDVITDRNIHLSTGNVGCNVCSVGWLLLNGKCYYFSENMKSWTESDRLCKSAQADLATVKPSQIILTGYVKSLRRDFWVGLKKESRDRYPGELWYWSDNTIEETIQEENSDFCVKIGQKLMTESCSTELLRICEKEAEKC